MWRKVAARTQGRRWPLSAGLTSLVGSFSPPVFTTFAPGASKAGRALTYISEEQQVLGHIIDGPTSNATRRKNRQRSTTTQQQQRWREPNAHAHHLRVRTPPPPEIPRQFSLLDFGVISTDLSKGLTAATVCSLNWHFSLLLLMTAEMFASKSSSS